MIGWAPIFSDSFKADLKRLREYRELKELRHIVQDESANNSPNRADFNRGIPVVTNSGLFCDILLIERQFPAASEFVDRHRYQLFVLDQIAKSRANR
jgi:L-fuconolactonase